MSEQEAFRPFGHGRKSYSCILCADHGDVLAQLKGTIEIYAFKCSCSAGQRSKKNYPQWPGEAAGYTLVL